MNFQNTSIPSVQAIMPLPWLIYWENTENIILGCNHSTATLLGYAGVDDIVGKSHGDIFSNSDSEQYHSQLHRVFNLEQMICDQEVVQKRDGSFIFLQSIKAPWRNEKQEIIGFINISFESNQDKPDIHFLKNWFTRLKSHCFQNNTDDKFSDTFQNAHQLTALDNTQKNNQRAVNYEWIEQISHDLRNPLMSILGESQGIETDAHTQELRESARCIQEVTKQLLGIADDVVEYMRLDAGYCDQVMNPFDPVEVIQKVIMLMRFAMKSKSLGYKLEIDPKLPSVVKGYGQYFERIVSGLLANAIQCSQTGLVTVYLLMIGQTSDEVTLKLMVEDTGPGLSSNPYKEILEQRSTVSSSKDADGERSALGIYFVKNYVGKMQGRIEVNSSIGKGSQFIVTLPFIKALAAATVDINHFRNQAEPVASYSTSCEITSLDTSKNRKIKVLVVEDSPLPARAVLHLLNDYDCEVKVVESGEDAVKAVINKRYDLVLMDIGLPGIDGIEATRQIRALPVHHDTPIVALTGHIREEKKPDCLKAGMQDVYSKPLMRQQLKKMFETYVYQKENIAAKALQMRIDPSILDIHAMQERFAMSNPLQLVGVLEPALEFIEENIEKIALAIQTKDVEALEWIVFNLKGSLAYVVAPQCHHLLIEWDRAFKQKLFENTVLYEMMIQIQEALSILKDAIESVLPGLR
jgi:two-component system aerobic respiration control sensor histidine kinase ArcB